MNGAEPRPGTEWIVGGGEMGELIRSMDWSQTPIGPIASWPQGLRTTVNICLASDLPICIIWGSELVQLYNDGYRVICGGKHPRSMGQNFRECWREAWPVIGEAHDSALAGKTAFLENQHIFLERHGYVEECFFTFSFSPIRDENGQQAGLFHPVIETTPKMLGERRTRTLRDLGSRTSEAKSTEEAFALTTKALGEYPLDLPFLLIYQLDERENRARLAAGTGLAGGMKGAPQSVALDGADQASWPLAEVFRTGRAATVNDIAQRFGNISAGPFPEPIESAVLLPITPPGAERPIAVAVAGINVRLKSNEMYRGFYDLLSGAITTAVANARAFEEARQRAEALAEIDRAKTAFFSNVSHEFRTPLTLMLGPTEELLALPPGTLPPSAREQIDVLHRNSLRLQKLVNSLLDFSRLEAGRIQASYEPVDLGPLTADLASVFRSAIEKAGLKFTVDCPPLPEPVHVDREMWEKIVLNLISNAFKFTLAGEIEVRLEEEKRQTTGAVQDAGAVATSSFVTLSVRDTGTGIVAGELPRIFERFHRVEGAVSRTHEGTGIGLALVQELVKLHGGTVRLESVFGKGSAFSVTLPKGTAHLPPDRLGTGRTLASTAVGAAPFLKEAALWLPEGSAGVPPESSAVSEESVGGTPTGAGETPALPRILLADDNADMRDYVRRLLAPHFHVETAPDGEAALERIQRHPPSLVITDVMMPRLNGFGLVQRLRADPRTRALPIILLSARAGEEARVEGLEAGADDYLIKPFSARELLARVESQLKLAALRREAGEQMRAINEQLQERVRETQQAHEALRDGQAQVQAALLGGAVGTWNWDLNTNLLTSNPSLLRIFGLNSAEGGWSPEAFIAAIVPEDQPKVREAIARALASDSNGLYETEYRVNSPEGKIKWFLARGQVEYGEARKPLRLPGALTDITGRKEAEEALRESEERFRMVADNMSQLAWTCDQLGDVTWYNQRWLDYTGLTFEEMKDWGWKQCHHPDHMDRVVASVQHSRATGQLWEDTFPLRGRDGKYRWFLSRAFPLRDAKGNITRWFGTNTDVTELRETEAKLTEAHELLASRAQQLEKVVEERTSKLRETVEELEAFSYSIAHDMRAPLRGMHGFSDILLLEHASNLTAEGQEFLRRIAASAHRMDNLIQDVLNYSRIVRADLPLARVDLDQLLRGLVDTYPMLASDQADIVLNDRLPPVLGNEAMLTQIFSNLLGNAVKFIAPGTKPRVRVWAQDSAPDHAGNGEAERKTASRSVKISVQDNGIGIPADQHDKIFEMFQRVDKDYEGTGIGLAIVRKAVERMGGKVGVQSEPGQGSTFWIELQRA